MQRDDIAFAVAIEIKGIGNTPRFNCSGAGKTKWHIIEISALIIWRDQIAGNRFNIVIIDQGFTIAERIAGPFRKGESMDFNRKGG